MSRGQEWTDQGERTALAKLQKERSRVAIYIRQSKTDKDKDGKIIGISLDQQLADCRRIPELSGLPDRVFRDEDKSGRETSKRTDYLAMTEAIRDGTVRAVACYDQSRISRSVKDFYEFMALCEDHGVLVFQVLGGLIRTDDEWSWGMRAFAASMQRKEIKKKVLAGMRRLKEEHGRVLGKIPPGYVRVKKLLVVDPEWARRAAVIFQLYATGRFSVETLARHLNDDVKMAAPYRLWRGKDGEWVESNRWAVDQLKTILKSPTYIGRTHVGRHHAVEQRDAAHEAIIPLALWEQCQAIRELNKRRKQAYRKKGAVESAPVGHALSGVLRCQRCGGPMHHQPGRKGQHWYRCAASYKGKTCDQKWVPAPELEDMVRHALAYVASPDQADPASVKRLAASMPRASDPKQALRDRMRKLDARAEAVGVRYERLEIDKAQYVAKMGAINEERLKTRMEHPNELKVDVAAGQRRLVSVIAEWDAAAQAGNGLVGVRRNQLVREVLEHVAVDRDDALGPMVTVSPTPAVSDGPVGEAAGGLGEAGTGRGPWRGGRLCGRDGVF